MKFFVCLQIQRVQKEADKEKTKYDQYLKEYTKVIEEFAAKTIEEGSLAGFEGTSVLRICREKNKLELVKKHKDLLECLEGAYAKIEGCNLDYPVLPGRIIC